MSRTRTSTRSRGRAGGHGGERGAASLASLERRSTRRRPRRRRSPRPAARARCTSPASRRRRRCRSSTAAGTTVATQSAELARRAAVPRTCRRPAGYRVRRVSDGAQSGALTVHSEQRGAVEPGDLQPVDPEQRLHVPHDPRRHEARDQRAPADEPGGRARPAAGHRRSRAVPTYAAAVPDADRVLGLRLRQPGRTRRAASRSSRT